jgi:hypothetical protein
MHSDLQTYEVDTMNVYLIKNTNEEPLITTLRGRFGGQEFVVLGNTLPNNQD